MAGSGCGKQLHSYAVSLTANKAHLHFEKTAPSFTTTAKIATEGRAVKGFRGINHYATLHYLFHVPLTALPSSAFCCLSGE